MKTTTILLIAICVGVVFAQECIAADHYCAGNTEGGRYLNENARAHAINWLKTRTFAQFGLRIHGLGCGVNEWQPSGNKPYNAYAECSFYASGQEANGDWQSASGALRIYYYSSDDIRISLQ